MGGFASILCVAGHDRAGERALLRAADLAERHRAPLTVLDVAEPDPPGWVALEGEGLAEGAGPRRRRELGARLARLGPDVALRARTVRAGPVRAVVDEVRRGGHDLVVRPAGRARGRPLGLAHARLLRLCPGTLWLHAPVVPGRRRHILAAVDVDLGRYEREAPAHRGLAARTLELAAALALAEDATLHLVHAWRTGPAPVPCSGMAPDVFAVGESRARAEHERALSGLLRHARSALGADAMARLRHREYVLDGAPHLVVPSLARQLDVDLVVMGATLRSRAAGLLGGHTAEAVLRRLDRSVLVVRPPAPARR